MGGRTEWIPTALLPAVEGECGPVARVEDRSWDHGEAQVLHVQGARGTCFVKRHRTLDHHRREVHAYGQWVAGWADVPRVEFTPAPTQPIEENPSPWDRLPETTFPDSGGGA